MKVSVLVLVVLVTLTALVENSGTHYISDAYNRNPKVLKEEIQSQQRETPIADVGDNMLKKDFRSVEKRTDQLFSHCKQLIDSKPCGVSHALNRMTSSMNRSSSLFRTERIVGGTATGGCQVVPWQVRVRKNSAKKSGGSIISDLHILTAAHVVDGIDPFDVDIVTGDYNRVTDEPSEQTARVKSVNIHPHFNSTTYEADIAVLTLWLPLTFSNDDPCTAPVCLVPTVTPDGSLCTVTGWGANASTGTRVSPHVLHMANVPTFTGRDCEKEFSIPVVHPVYIANTDTQLCAGYSEGGGVDACWGDSGGPLVCLNPGTNTYVQAGVTSNGLGCGDPEFPGLYTSVAGYIDWILEKMDED